MRRAPRSVARRQAGSAAIEFMYAVPFLLLFALAMVDFSRTLVTRQRAVRAARHVAWTAARRADDESLPESPAQEQVREVHFRGRSGDVKVESGEYPLPSPVSEGVPDFPDLPEELPTGWGPDFRGLPEFLAGHTAGWRGYAAQSVGALSVLAAGDHGAAHYVALDPARERQVPAQDARGWWDPIEMIKGEFEKLFPW